MLHTVTKPNEKFNIILAVVFHIALIILDYFFIDNYGAAFGYFFLLVGGVYFLYWIISNRKSYMPWKVYLVFVIGTITQLLLSLEGIIPKEYGTGEPGVGKSQFLYCILILFLTILIGIANYILHIIDSVRKNKENEMEK